MEMTLLDTLAMITLRVGQPKETLLQEVTNSGLSESLDLAGANF
jgi:hypothetical protein